MTDDLKPCPFCGGEARYKEYTGEYQNQVTCTTCPAEINGTWLEDPRTVAAWNTRAPHLCIDTFDLEKTND